MNQKSCLTQRSLDYVGGWGGSGVFILIRSSDVSEGKQTWKCRSRLEESVSVH